MKKELLIFLVVFIFFLVITNFISGDLSSLNYSISPYSISSGGKNASSSNYIIDTIFGIFLGETSSSSYKTELGFYFSEDEVSPKIFFQGQTLHNASTTTNLSVEINVSVIDNNLDEFVYNWNTTNYTLFNDSLVLMMNFDKRSELGENDTFVKDLSGYGNDGTCLNCPSWVSSGKYGGSFDFDGNDDYVRKDFFDNLPSSKLTLCAWIKTSSDGVIIQQGRSDSDANTEYIFKVISSKLNFWDYEGSYGFKLDQYSNNIVSDDIWHYVCFVKDELSGVYYLDGVFDGNETALKDCSYSNNDFVLGKDYRDNNNFFNGVIDEVRIYNRSLSAEEIQILYMSNLRKYNETKWEFYINQSKNSTVDLEPGNYTYQAFVKDDANNWNSTEIREVEVILGNSAPEIPLVNLVSVDGSNKSSSDLNCSAIINDTDGDSVNPMVRWYLNGVQEIEINYTSDYETSTTFSSILKSGNTTKNENWSCSIRFDDGLLKSGWGNSSNLTILNSFPIVNLSYPTNGLNIVNRTPNFNWTSSDADGDILEYEINITLLGSSNCVDPERDITGINDENYTIAESSYLKCLHDNQDWYQWKVRASDDFGLTYGNWTDLWNFTIDSVLTIELLNDTINFGSINITQTNDTSDDNPLPFLIENKGNCLINVTLNSTPLWTSIRANSDNYRYKVDNKTGESGAFDYELSDIDWTQVPIYPNNKTAIVYFNWSNANDLVEIDLFVEVPENEPPGSKFSNITFISRLAE
jgi:hypothetical protein